MSAPSATCLCRLPEPPARKRPSVYSLHRNDMAYCHFELCRDCGLGCFSESLLADIRRLSVVAVVFLYQITVFFYNKTQQRHFWNFILMTQCKLYACSTKRGCRWGRCSIYRHRLTTPGPYRATWPEMSDYFASMTVTSRIKA